MKYSSVITLAALAAVLSAPVFAAGSEMDEAVRLASRNSKAGLDAICEATYKAVKKDPENADKIFEAVLGQRADWTASDVYAIFRSVLLARPDLMKEIHLLVNTHRSSGKNAKNAANEGQLVGNVNQTTVLSPMLARLLNVVYDAGLPAGVAQEGINMTIAVIAGTYAYAYQSAFNHTGGNTNMEGPSISTMLEFIPTPGDMTPGAPNAEGKDSQK